MSGGAQEQGDDAVAGFLTGAAGVAEDFARLAGEDGVVGNFEDGVDGLQILEEGIDLDAPIKRGDGIL